MECECECECQYSRGEREREREKERVRLYIYIYIYRERECVYSYLNTFVTGLKLGVSAQCLELDHARTLDDGGADSLEDIAGSDKGATGGHKVVNHEHTLASRDGRATHTQSISPTVIVSLVFFGIVLAADAVGQLALLADHDEGLLQGQGDRGTKHKAACIQAGNAIHVERGIAAYKDIDGQLEDLGVMCHTADVVKTRNTMERVVGDHRGCGWGVGAREGHGHGHEVGRRLCQFRLVMGSILWNPALPIRCASGPSCLNSSSPIFLFCEDINKVVVVAFGDQIRGSRSPSRAVERSREESRGVERTS